MSLSQDIVDQFVKTMKKDKNTNNEATLNGTYKKVGDKEYVQIDGSDILTPVNSTVEAEDGERVKVTVKNHTATVTGNISSPAARNKDVNNIKDTVDEFGNTIKQMDNTITQQGNSIIQMDNNIKQVQNDILQANNQINQQNNTIEQFGNTITEQGDKIDSMNNTITQHGNDIESMNNTIEQHNNKIEQNENDIKQQGNTIEQQGNIIQQHGDKITSFENQINQQGDSITSLNNRVDQQDNVISQHGDDITSMGNTIVQQGNNILMLNSAFTIVDGKLVGLDEIIINELKANHLDTAYASIDFANITAAAVEKLFSDSGIIKDLVVQEGHITGELVGVTLKGDLIEGNTIVADKLVVKGSDGLYYKLNTDGLNNISTEQAQKFVAVDGQPADWETNYKDYYIISDNNYIHPTDEKAPEFTTGTYYKLSDIYESGLDGTNIVAKSITADKVTVNDLVAFDATIGGFDITEHSIHSHSKDNVNAPAQGLYMDDSGQMNLGDDKQCIKYYKDEDGKWKLMIKIDEIYTSSSSKSIADQIKELKDTVDNVATAVMDVDVKYALSDSATEPPSDDQWSTTAPEWQEGKYMWQKTFMTLTDGTTSESEPTCIQGAQGQNGKDGTPGEPGKDGAPGKDGTSVTISSTSIEYVSSKDGKNIPSEGWSSSIPTITNGEYLWTKTTVKYSDGKNTVSYSVSYIGTNGTNGKDGQQGPKGDDGAPGKDGAAGKAGNGITSITYYYKTTTNQTSPAAADITGTTIPTLSATNKYLWQKEVIKFTDASDKVTVLLIAVYGDKGDKGNTGDKGATGVGIKSVTELYYLSNSNTTAPAAPTAHITSTVTTANVWTTKCPVYQKGYYYWVCSEILYTDNTYKWTTVLLQNGINNANEKVENMQIGGRNLIWNSTMLSKYNDLTRNYDFYTLNSITSKGITDDGYHIVTPGKDQKINNGVGLFFSKDNENKPMFPNNEYTFSCDIKGKFGEEAIGGYIGIAYQNSETAAWYSKIKSIIEFRSTINETNYNRYIAKFVVPDEAKWGISIQFLLGWNADVYIKNCKLEKGNMATDWTPAPEDNQQKLDYIESNYVKETTFTDYKSTMEANDQGIKQRLSKTEVTVYGDTEKGTEGLESQASRLDEQINGQNGIDGRLETAEGTLENTGLNDYDPKVKISQRFLDIETDVDQIKNVFKLTGGRNLVHNSVGYFSTTNSKTNKLEPNLWTIKDGTTYEPFGYDAGSDLVGNTISRGQLTCINGMLTSNSENITALLSNKMLSLSFKYKNEAHTTSTIKIFNGSVTFFTKTFSSTVTEWTEYSFNPDIDPANANNSFLCTTSSLQISIESKYTDTTTSPKSGFQIADLMLNYGDIKPWELSSNEIYGAMVRLSNLGLEVTATTANTKNFMTTDGILVYAYDPTTDRIIGTQPITKITDNGTLTNMLESTGDIIERNLVHTMILDSASNNVYVEYIR